jgi:TolA-binding protein
MKKNKLTGKQINILINLLFVALFAFSYFYIYTDLENKTIAAQEEIRSTKQEIRDQERMLSEEASLQQSLEQVNSQLQEIIDEYPVNIAKEDNFMFIEQMEKALDIDISSLDVKDGSLLYQTILPIRNEDGTEIFQAATDADTVNEAEPSATDTTDAAPLEDLTTVDTAEDVQNEAEEPAIQTMIGMQTLVSMNFVSTYEGFKRLVDYIKNYPDKTVIDNVVVSYDSSTGNLAGSMVLKRFALTGTGKDYQPPYIEDISIGTENIFGTN